MPKNRICEHKYLVIGGYVIASDGDKHYINPIQLCLLYGLDPNTHNIVLRGDERKAIGFDDTWIRLYPQSSGNYKLDCARCSKKK